MKTLLTLLITLSYLTAFAQSDMWYSKCASVEGPFVGQQPDIVNFFVDDTSYLQEHPEYQLGWNRVLRFATQIMCMGPDYCIPQSGTFTYDPAHDHIHIDSLIVFKIYDQNMNPLPIATTKIGYAWVDSSPFVTNTCMTSELAPYGGFTSPNLPPNPNFSSQSPGMTPGYTDIYSKQTFGNGIVLGYYDENMQNYQGLDQGLVFIESYARFDQVLNQGDNLYPDSWSTWAYVDGMTVDFNVLPPVAPPLDLSNLKIDYNFKTTLSPILSWSSATGASSYEIKRFVEKGSVIVELAQVEVQGTSFVDTDIKIAASVHPLLQGNGAKFISYQVRSKNVAGYGNWITAKRVKL